MLEVTLGVVWTLLHLPVMAKTSHLLQPMAQHMLQMAADLVEQCWPLVVASDFVGSVFLHTSAHNSQEHTLPGSAANQ